MIKMNRNKEYRLKRKAQRKDYIIQDKNFTIKTLYYRNETKRNKIDQLQQENQQLKEQLKDENTYCEEANKWYKEAFQLQNNWNELKKWIEEDTEVAETNFEMGRCFNMFDLLNKMQELEGNNE